MKNKPKIGDRVASKVSGATGSIVKINKKNPSSPLVVQWDRGGSKSNENLTSIELTT